jgi:hypothetical protein
VEPARRAGGCTKLGASRRMEDDHGNDRILKHKRNLQQSTILHRISGVKHAFSCLPAVEQRDSQTEKEGAESEVSLLRKAKKVGLLTRQVVLSGLGTAKESEVSWACGRGEIGDFPPFLPSCCRVLCPAPCTAVQTDRESRPPTSKDRVSNLSFFFGPHHKHPKSWRGAVRCGASDSVGMSGVASHASLRNPVVFHFAPTLHKWAGSSSYIREEECSQ